MAALETEPPALAAASQSPVSHSKDPFVGNVSKISPHHGGSSKQSYKKGNLIFDACFEGGKLVLLLGSPTPLLFSLCVQAIWGEWISLMTLSMIYLSDLTPAILGTRVEYPTFTAAN